MKKIHYLILILLLVKLNSCQKNNCSEEVLQQFIQLNHTVQHNNVLLQHTIDDALADMAEISKTKPQFVPLLNQARAVQKITAPLLHFVDTLYFSLIEQTGGIYTKEEALALQKSYLIGQAKHPNERAIVQQFLLGKSEAQAIVLDQQIQLLKNNYLNLLKKLWNNGGIKGTIFADPRKKQSSIEQITEALQLLSSQYYIPSQQHPTWATFTFGDRPLVAILPIISRIKNAILQSEYKMISFLENQFSHRTYHCFLNPIALSSKSSIPLGETYETEITLADYGSEAPIFIIVNGDTLDMAFNRATYTVRPESTGEQSYTAQIAIKNPHTGEVEKFTKQFYFEVTK